MTSYIYDMVDTWNAGATTFTAVKMNVTDTASASGSLLMDLQVGGTSRFSVSKAGRITAVGIDAGLAGNSPSYIARLCIAGNDDVWLTRRGANNLRFGQADAAAPVAQTLSVQSVVAGTTNTAGANLTITGSQGTGTGAGGSIVFQVAPAGSSGTAQNALATAWSISGAGHFLAGADNTYDIGASGANRPRSVYVGSNVIAGGYLAAGVGSAVFFGGNARSRASSPADGDITISNAAASDFAKLQFGGTTSSFPAIKRSSTTLQARLADDSAFASVQGKITTETAYTAGAPTATGYLVLYDSTGTAYRVPAVLN